MIFSSTGPGFGIMHEGSRGTLDKSPEAFRTISEVAGELDVPQHVLRFWESRFREIKPMKRGGGRRYYRPDDVTLLRGIRHLLYGEGYTIRGVQRILREQGIRFVQTVWQPGAPQPSQQLHDDGENGDDEAAPRNAGEAERSRKLFSLLPSLLGPAEQADAEPSPESRLDPHAQRFIPPAPGAILPREDLRRLQAALHELGECRKLLDAALRDS
jgi:DNA-binding transcriptional MerR regulator